MADNVGVLPASGPGSVPVAADEVAGVQHQLVKVEFGPDGSATRVDTGTGLPVAPTSSGDVAAALTNGRKTVAVPATTGALAAFSIPCRWVLVTALLSNTDQVNVGGPAVLATIGASTGTPLQAGDSISLPVANVNLAFVDARVAGEGVSWVSGL